MRVYIFLYLATVLGVYGADPPVFDHGVDLDTTRPLVVAHRGFCGAYPDHTMKAYEEAIKHGADVIECDVVVTKDLQLVCLHEPYMKGTTDVEEHPEFADRQKTQLVGASLISNDWFTPDFTLAELKTLRMKQRLSYRDPNYNGQFQIVTLEEQIELVKNSSRKIGLYPETKSPSWFNGLDILQNAGKQFEDLLLEVLTRYGYTDATHPCFVQSFDEASLQYMAAKTNLPMIMLISSGRRGDSITNEELSAWKEFCYGIGPSKRSIVYSYSGANGDKNWISDVTDLVDRAHAAGLKVHPYTFRNEDRYLAWDYMQDPWYEFDKFFEIGIDGYFTDFTPTLANFLEEKYRVCETPTSATGPASSTTTESNTNDANILTTSLLIMVLSAIIAVINH